MEHTNILERLLARQATSRETSVTKLSDSKSQDLHPGEINRDKTDSSSAARNDEPPDGGLIAWLQIVASMLLFFNTWGPINSFGVFQTYCDGALFTSPSDVAWIGTFQAFQLLFIGAVTGRLYDRGYLRALLLTGTFMTSFGLMMVSLSTRYYQVFLSQSVVIGLGSGCLLIPSMAIPAQYFSHKRSFAIGIAATGGSIGAVIYPIVFRRLQMEASFGWATRIMGFIALGTLGTAASLFRARLPPSKIARALVDMSAMHDPAFIVLTLNIFLYLMGLYIPFFYITTWAKDSLGLDADLSFYMFTIMNAGSVFGRVIPGLLADRLGSLNVLIMTIMISGILIFAWISVNGVADLVLFCICYGFFSGACFSLPASVIASITPELNKVGTWMGMCFSVAGLGLLIGNPIAGAILDASQGKSFIGSQSFGAATMLAGGVCLCGLRYMRFKKDITWDMKA